MSEKREKKFLSGDEAFAEGIRLARPAVISAYPITPQTIVVEKLSEMVERGDLAAKFIHVESEHSALSSCIGASATGVRTFTATSSQGLLYMAECLPYASGGRHPIVMMNANRSIALPWSIYGDQRDSLSQLDSGWIQVYTENAQESLDMALQAYAIAEDTRVSLPVMVNLDGFVLTHTYEAVEIPTEEEADAFLPPFFTENAFDPACPKVMGGAAGPEVNTYFQIDHHRSALAVREVIKEADARFEKIFGRKNGGLAGMYRTEDADLILVTLGSVSGLARSAVDCLREEGLRAGLLKLRFLRPFPDEELLEAVKNAKAVGVLEKDISFGGRGTVYTNAAAVLAEAGLQKKLLNFIAGLGGKNISKDDLIRTFRLLEEAAAGGEAFGEPIFLQA